MLCNAGEAAAVVAIVRAALAAGTPPHAIAVLTGTPAQMHAVLDAAARSGEPLPGGAQLQLGTYNKRDLARLGLKAPPPPGEQRRGWRDEPAPAPAHPVLLAELDCFHAEAELVIASLVRQPGDAVASALPLSDAGWPRKLLGRATKQLVLLGSRPWLADASPAWAAALGAMPVASLRSHG